MALSVVIGTSNIKPALLNTHLTVWLQICSSFLVSICDYILKPTSCPPALGRTFVTLERVYWRADKAVVNFINLTWLLAALSWQLGWRSDGSSSVLLRWNINLQTDETTPTAKLFECRNCSNFLCYENSLILGLLALQDRYCTSFITLTTHADLKE